MGPGFVETNLLIALGVSADAVALTLCDFHANARWRRALAWVAAVTLTHALLPLVGLTGVWLAADRFPATRAPLLALGALILAALIAQALREAWHSFSAAGAPAPRESAATFLAKVAVVSVDAALVGPGNGAVAMSWSETDLATSCLLLLIFVGAVLSLSVGLASFIARWANTDPLRAKRLCAAARVGQGGVVLPVFTYFLIVALAGVFAEVSRERRIAEAAYPIQTEILGGQR